MGSEPGSIFTPGKRRRRSRYKSGFEYTTHTKQMIAPDQRSAIKTGNDSKDSPYVLPTIGKEGVQQERGPYKERYFVAHIFDPVRIG